MSRRVIRRSYNIDLTFFRLKPKWRPLHRPKIHKIGTILTFNLLFDILENILSFNFDLFHLFFFSILRRHNRHIVRRTLTNTRTRLYNMPDERFALSKIILTWEITTSVWKWNLPNFQAKIPLTRSNYFSLQLSLFKKFLSFTKWLLFEKRVSAWRSRL